MNSLESDVLCNWLADIPPKWNWSLLSFDTEYCSRYLPMFWSNQISPILDRLWYRSTKMRTSEDTSLLFNWLLKQDLAQGTSNCSRSQMKNTVTVIKKCPVCTAVPVRYGRVFSEPWTCVLELAGCQHFLQWVIKTEFHCAWLPHDCVSIYLEQQMVLIVLPARSKVLPSRRQDPQCTLPLCQGLASAPGSHPLRPMSRLFPRRWLWHRSSCCSTPPTYRGTRPASRSDEAFPLYGQQNYSA